jgi:4-aminobutyrate aminotransferase-like enzyme
VAATVEQIRNAGRVPAFISESLPGCGGQIVPPDGYLREAYRHVRSAGGVCIADEVQVGFGRVGTHFWAFETQGVVPDIVTLGKPIGNGHPLGAVVTTPEIAASFATGMEYFNTFGGNPVSCAIGLAVLDVIEEERLQENSLKVGARLMDGLRELMESHSLIGDVRGLGLFVGVELVLDRDTLEPAPSQADHLVNRMKERGILVSTDGPFHNVIKIKPPLVFTEANADMLVTTMDKILKEDFFDA